MTTSISPQHLSGFFDECLMDVGVSVEQFAHDNANGVEKIDWSRVSAEKVLNDKSLRKSLLGAIQTCIETLQDDQAGELLDRARTSLSDNESQTGKRASQRLIANVVKHLNYSNLPKRCVKDVIKDL
jgi:hypothetical protein